MSKIKPVSLASIFGKPEPLRDTGTKPKANVNRFSALRSRSPSTGGPPLSPSVKRPGGDEDLPVGKAPRLDGNRTFERMRSVESMIDKGKKGMAKLKDDLAKLGEDNNPLKELLGGIVDSIDFVFGTMENVVSAVVDGVQHTSTGKGYAAAANKTAGQAPAVIVQKPAPTPAEVKKKKFVTAVKEAEKSLLIFQLDLGKVPVMNTGTIARKVTEDITR